MCRLCFAGHPLRANRCVCLLVPYPSTALLLTAVPPLYVRSDADVVHVGLRKHSRVRHDLPLPAGQVSQSIHQAYQ